MAQQLTTEADKSFWLKMAAEWHSLAEKVDGEEIAFRGISGLLEAKRRLLITN